MRESSVQKASHAWESVQNEDRLTTPLIKKDGKLVKASWDEALDLVASRLKEIHKANGRNSVAFQVSCRTPNEECYEMQKLARVGFGTNYVDNCARICHGPSVAGLSLSFGSGAATNGFADALNADCVFMIGSNALEAHPLAGRRVIQAKEKGAHIIVCDPRFSTTAKQAERTCATSPHLKLPCLIQ